MNWISLVAKNRQNPAVRLTAKAAQRFIRAYENQANWDIASNGETFFAEKVMLAAPGAVFDVGANYGVYARMCLALPGAHAVHAFEISPPTADVLLRNCSGLPGLKINAFGLGAAEGTVVIHHAPGSPDRTGIVAIDDGYARQMLTAQIRTGDNYMQEARLDTVSLLKIDAEGMDLDILKGFSGALRDGRISAIQFEHGHPNVETGVFLRQIVRFLEDFGLLCFRLYPQSLERIERVTYAMEDFRGRNYVALLPSMCAAFSQGASRLADLPAKSPVPVPQ